MRDISIAEIVDEAHALIDSGDQGDAEVLLSRTLAAALPVTSQAEAVAVAQATGLLIRLKASIGSFEDTDDRLEAMASLTSGFDSEDVVVARVEAELQVVEWVHELQDDNDPVSLVDALRVASALAARWGGSILVGVRRAAAEAGLTAHLIRSWLGQDAGAAVIGMESLAVALAGEDDERMRSIRVQSLSAAATGRENRGDLADALALFRMAADESKKIPRGQGYRLRSLLRIGALLDATGGDPRPVHDEILDELHAEAEDAAHAALQCRYLDLVVEQIRDSPSTVGADDGAEVREDAEWNDLLIRARRSEDAAIRNAVLEYIRLRGGGRGSLSEPNLQLLLRADSIFRDDHATETATARLRLAARIVEILGHPGDTNSQRDAAAAVRFSEEAERRFLHGSTPPEDVPEILRLRLERALRLSEIGEGAAAITLLRDSRPSFSSSASTRHLLAQAQYWTARLLRERGASEESTMVVSQTVDEFGADPDPDVRIWAANSLFSLWRSDGVTKPVLEEASTRFSELFGDERDPRFRRLDASRLITLAHLAHERGDIEGAVRCFREVVERYGDSDEHDGDIVDSVRLARENLRILGLSDRRHGEGVRDDRYFALRDRLYEADPLLAAGLTEQAVQIWKEILDETAGAVDADTAMLGLAALDAWGGYLEANGRWAELHDVAVRATVIRADADSRARRVRARAHLRLAAALNHLGDAAAAISVYLALEALAASDDEDEVSSSRQQATYNRAVLLDDLGNVSGALVAYDQVVSAQDHRIDTPAARLRKIKALRNKARLLDGSGRIAESASAHRQILDIAMAAPDAESSKRARASAFDLARSFERLGDLSSAAATYAWIGNTPSIGFTRDELRAASKARKVAEREARRRQR